MDYYSKSGFKFVVFTTMNRYVPETRQNVSFYMYRKLSSLCKIDFFQKYLYPTVISGFAANLFHGGLQWLYVRYFDWGLRY